MGNILKGKPSEAEIITKKIETARATGVLNIQSMNLKSSSQVWVTIVEDGTATKLRSLDISNNSMKSLPQEISLMINLKTLNASSCNIQRISTTLTTLIRLQNLDFSHNDLEAGTIETLPSIALQKVNFSNNHFNMIPKALFPLTQLIELDLSGNRIESMSGIGNLISLQLLNLDDNNITEISQDASILIKLKKISLRNNRIAKMATSVEGQSIPESFFTNTFVEAIDLTGNPIGNHEILQFNGIDEFMERRKKVKDKALQGGALVDMSVFGLK